jgi:hypothetical protein
MQEEKKDVTSQETKKEKKVTHDLKRETRYISLTERNKLVTAHLKKKINSLYLT